MALAVRFAFPVGLLAIVVLSACSKGEADGKPAFEIVAKVNEQEIQANELNSMVANGAPPGSEDGAVLERLIDQELMVQQARERNLDRDPRVLKSFEAAQREILARAYLEQVTEQISPPTAKEVAAFYAAHPELFAKRRIYSLEEVEIDLPAGRFEELRALARPTASLQEVTDWLTGERIVFRLTNSVTPAEQLPFDSLKGFARMKDGQMVLTQTPGGALLVRLAASRTAPLNETSARPMIERYLINARKVALAKAEVERLRGRARIEYPAKGVRPAETKGVASVDGARGLAAAPAPTSPTDAAVPETVAAPDAASLNH
ncbi:MAG TPA: EpsD family peptidyl-prolyl cis-trans isomerase [Aromatoleum sp.]|uniref:EpsD family peptidyl-prolyl cis-trans isomerase n=1 Tax=Aromatoleum sp. TaxID=2307007 RepID=UPI002B47D297|nr:EpsD family peptidyl-prolyl cis-trans isomerase [Aromatoleum sp.]HJV27113.1 EpsD family peptidyl-prolyl cis-trans isomerase [Aromatoleum sp.]